MSKTSRLLLILAGLVPAGIALAAGGDLGQVDKQPTNWVAIAMFGFFVLATLWITKWAAAKTKSAADFYTAGGGITGFQNGLAIAGDFMSAASFLGITAAVMANGYDGLIYAIGFLVGWPILTFLMAERLRNLGKYTFADVAGYRFAPTAIRSFAASGTLVVVLFYLIAQMVGAGALIKLLFGLDYWVAVTLVGVLMMIYVLFGGMTATTWVQIIKAVLLLTGVTFMAVAIMWHFNFSFEALFAEGVRVKTAVAASGGASPEDAAKAGLSIMGPGGFVKDPISAISFGMALMFGTAGLPHILMRFFTVPDAKQARKSVLWATTWIGYFYILIFIIGFGAIALVLTNPQFADVATGTIHGGKGAANMAAVLVGNAVGGNVFMGFISAVAFATILAVVAGLTLSGASAVSHDLYATVIKKGNPAPGSELKVSRATTLVLGVDDWFCRHLVVLGAGSQPAGSQRTRCLQGAADPCRNRPGCQWRLRSLIDGLMVAVIAERRPSAGVLRFGDAAAVGAARPGTCARCPRGPGPGGRVFAVVRAYSGATAEVGTGE